MRIYLACTVRGDRGAVEGLRALVIALENEGHIVLTKHLLEDSVETAESALSEREVYERDIDWLTSCDVLIADASGSSYGVGFEVGYVLGQSATTSQRVVLVYRTERRDRISRLIVGNSHPRCVCISYANPEEMKMRVVRALSQPALSQPEP